MRRLQFIKNLIGAATVATIPKAIAATSNKSIYTFDELFFRPFPNERLVYPRKECKLYLEIKSKIGENRIVDEKKFAHYYPYHHVAIAVKGSYSIEDFEPLFRALKTHYEKERQFSEYDKGVFFRMIKESPELMHFDLFGARSW